MGTKQQSRKALEIMDDVANLAMKVSSDCMLLRSQGVEIASISISDLSKLAAAVLLGNISAAENYALKSETSVVLSNGTKH